MIFFEDLLWFLGSKCVSAPLARGCLVVVVSGQQWPLLLVSLGAATSMQSVSLILVPSAKTTASRGWDAKVVFLIELLEELLGNRERGYPAS